MILTGFQKLTLRKGSISQHSAVKPCLKPHCPPLFLRISLFPNLLVKYDAVSETRKWNVETVTSSSKSPLTNGYSNVKLSM